MVFIYEPDLTRDLPLLPLLILLQLHHRLDLLT